MAFWTRAIGSAEQAPPAYPRFATFRWVLPIALALIALAQPQVARAKPAADPGAQVCELEWDASFGRVQLIQRISGSGTVQSESLTISRAISGGNGLGTSLVLSETGTTRTYVLWLGGPSRKGKDLRLVFAVPGGEPLLVVADQGAYRVALDQAQLAYLLSAPGKVPYRLVKHDRKGRERAQLAAGELDLSQLAGQDLAGLPEAARRARAVLAQAISSTNAPCAMGWAADMNAAYSSEPARKWLSFDCGEEWSSPLGAFALQPGSFVWQPRAQDGVQLKFSASLQSGLQTSQSFIADNRDGRSRYGTISLQFPGEAWQMNFRGKDQALWQRQSGELSRGGQRIGKVLTPTGATGFFWSEFSQLLADNGDLTITARDSVSGLRLDTVLSWSEIDAAEAELRAGQLRLRERERDPLSKCRMQVQEESGMEDEIVT